MKTLSYDCGNPVQYVCGQTPAVLLYLLDRHAPLAMTKGTKWLIPQSLTTPGLTTHATHRAGPGVAHPSNGGELSTFPSRSKFPFTTGGVTDSRLVAKQVPLCGRIWLLALALLRNKVPHLAEGCPNTGPRENAIFVGGWGGVVCRPKFRRRVKHE